MTLGRKRMRHEQLTFLASFISPWSWGLSPVPLVTIELCDISSSDPRCNTRKKPIPVRSTPTTNNPVSQPAPIHKKKEIITINKLLDEKSTNCIDQWCPSFPFSYGRPPGGLAPAVCTHPGCTTWFSARLQVEMKASKEKPKTCRYPN